MKAEPWSKKPSFTVSKTPHSGQAGPLSLQWEVRKSSKQLRIFKRYPREQLEDKLFQDKVTLIIPYPIEMFTVGLAHWGGPATQHPLSWELRLTVSASPDSFFWMIASTLFDGSLSADIFVFSVGSLNEGHILLCPGLSIEISSRWFKWGFSSQSLLEGWF